MIGTKKPDFIAGEVILINKPLNWTSFDIVKKIRNNYNIKKIGHAGTLDPLATGLLILCTGKLTKYISKIQALEKEYIAEITLGATTPSFDRETEINSFKQIPSSLNINEIKKALKNFVGTIYQKPPIYSAIKKNGRKLYDYARSGKNIEINERKVTIKEIEILSLNIPYIKIKVVCSKGTYIRSLANDIGNNLNVGGYLNNLIRTRIGDYNIESAYTIEEYLIKYNR